MYKDLGHMISHRATFLWDLKSRVYNNNPQTIKTLQEILLEKLLPKQERTAIGIPLFLIKKLNLRRRT